MGEYRLLYSNGVHKFSADSDEDAVFIGIKMLKKLSREGSLGVIHLYKKGAPEKPIPIDFKVVMKKLIELNRKERDTLQ